MIWICSCGARMESEYVLAHWRVVHGTEFECWPDGEPVVWDDTLTPADFCEDSDW